jgi:UDP:flavonoid glycosyltransferase YjiC (YdhE family)
MVRVAVTSCMYLGDTTPFVPVARRLHEAGYDVTLVAPEGFRSVLEPEPFDHAPYALDCSPAALDADPIHTRLMRHPFMNASRLATLWMDRAFADDPAAATASLRDSLDGADVVVTHPTMASVTLPVARSLGAAVVVGHLFPMMIPTTRWAPPVGWRTPRLPRPLSRATWQLLRMGTQLLFRDREINKLRRSCGLAPLRGNAGWAWMEADATVILASPHYFGPGAPDWPPVTWGGFSIWPDPARPLDRELSAYVEAGPPPVVVTLGTSAATGAGEKFAHIAADLDAAGLRSILLVGHERNLASVSSHPAAVTFAPLTTLLPRCSVAVVSGALGGLAAALAAGVPVVVHPQLVDQSWHARRVAELGVGLPARRTRDVGPTAARVAADPTFTERAQALAARMVDEDAPGAVLDTVQQLIA